MPSEIAKHLDRAEKAIAKGKPDLALGEYLEVLQEDPQNDKVRESTADLYVTLNRPTEAAALLSPFFDRLASIGDVGRAIIVFKKIARLGTPALEQWFRFGQLVEKSNRREALEAYEIAVSGFIESGRRPEAHAAVERIVALEPTEQNYRREGDLALELGDNKAASVAFFQAGHIARQAGRDGTLWFQQAYAADPENLPAALAFGRVVLDRGDAARAITILERFASVAGSNLELSEIYGRGLLAAGRPKEAEPFIWPLYQRDPTQVAHVEQLLRGFLKNQAHASALALTRKWEAAEHKRGRRREFAKSLRDIADQCPLELEYLEYLVQVFNNASREPDYCKALLKLFDLHYAARNYFKAADALDRAAEVDPYEPGHHQRLERLQGKIDSHMFNAIANRLQTVASTREEAPVSTPEEAQSTVLEDLVLQAEIFLQYSMRSKALERLQRVNKLFPYEEEKNQKLQQLFLASGFSPDYKGVPRPAGMPAPVRKPAAEPPVPLPAGGDEQSVDNIARVNEITRNIYRQANVKNVLFTTVNEVGRHWQVSRCIAGLCALGKPPSAALEYCAPNVKQSEVMAIVKLIAAVLPLAEQRGVVSLAEADSSAELAGIPEVVASLDIRSLLAVPLVDGERIAGILLLEQCGASRRWREAEVMVLKTIADQVVQALQNARLRSLVRNLAVTDERSGLLKRSSYLDLLLSEVRRAQQQKSMLTVMLFYFGKTSALVKECGEAAVRDMMLQVGQIMASSLRQTDTGVRYDLTTVALILGDTNAKNAFFVVEKMRKALASVKIPGTDRELTMAAGIAEAAFQHNFDPVDIVTEVINRAESALEIALAEGGNKAHSIAPDLRPLAAV